jgi:hypothetical protein
MVPRSRRRAFVVDGLLQPFPNECRRPLMGLRHQFFIASRQPVPSARPAERAERLGQEEEQERRQGQRQRGAHTEDRATPLGNESLCSDGSKRLGEAV